MFASLAGKQGNREQAAQKAGHRAMTGLNGRKGSFYSVFDARLRMRENMQKGINNLQGERKNALRAEKSGRHFKVPVCQF
ncbi:hypothetical protein [Thalassospira sp. TSL5-1]|uniref:hypothetical protein n=1 Tax=Thalassospira sp. TSL5-1 TaxID=1544451 RepID=UPI001160EEE4|nr:hypothetical protein [Thalassospira sp. TSL5-1]